DLLKYGYWPEPVWHDVVRLLGAHPDFDKIGASTRAFTTALYNLWCQPRSDQRLIAALCAPENRPEELRHLSFDPLLRRPDQPQKWLRDMVADEIRTLQELVRTLQATTGKDARGKVIRMSLLPHGDLSQNFLRYHREFKATVLSASGALPKV